MGEYRFEVKGEQRKELVNAISEILNQPKKYLGAPTYGFTVGSITIDKDGTATGLLSYKLLETLAERGFVPETDVEEMTTEPEMETSEISDEVTAPEEIPERIDSEICTEENHVILPLQGFTPESLDMLSKMILAKEVLIKKALGATTLPIRIIDHKIVFDWFKSCNSEDMEAYRQFIEALSETAKEKKRVTAKPQEHFENERFTMRVWLIGLGLIGREYSRIRQLLTKPLSGNSAFRFGKPETEVEEAAPEIAASEAAIAAEEAPANEALEDAALEAEDANVADFNASTTADDGEADGDE